MEIKTSDEIGQSSWTRTNLIHYPKVATDHMAHALIEKNSTTGLEPASAFIEKLPQLLTVLSSATPDLFAAAGTRLWYPCPIAG